MEGGRHSMPWDMTTNTNHVVIHFPILIIPVGVIIRISTGETPNKANNKAALGNNPRGSFPKPTAHLKIKPNPAQVPQVRLLTMMHFLRY
ncbi:hypothetical protein ACFX14_022664 [Malus domestica]